MMIIFTISAFMQKSTVFIVEVVLTLLMIPVTFFLTIFNSSQVIVLYIPTTISKITYTIFVSKLSSLLTRTDVHFAALGASD